MSPASSKDDLLPGTLDLIVLKTLDTLGPLHGYGITRRIRQVSEDSDPAQSGQPLSGSPPARAEGLDQVGVGAHGYQARGPVLQAHGSRPAATG